MSEKSTAFPLWSGPNQGCPLFPLLFMSTRSLARAVRQEKEVEVIQVEEKKQNYLFTNDTILYTENPK